MRLAWVMSMLGAAAMAAVSRGAPPEVTARGRYSLGRTGASR
ncbi:MULTISPECIES: hypothetical protein [Nonomuraea]|uniref:Uncharacterized protein n=1 Tax=Nonomuraea mangrovi TaxID=2316207 RepID=A0ABW4STM9_9ACTN